MSEIRFYDRYAKTVQSEKVYGDFFVKLLYGNLLGRTLERSLLASRAFSRIYGLTQDSKLSGLKVDGFVKKFDIRMDEFERGPFRCFNDFFIRKFLPGARPLSEGLVAPAEARYLGFNQVRDDLTYPVKGQYLSTERVLAPLRTETRARLSGGPLLIARLCPVDYHRFHFPADGKVLGFFLVPGGFHSVNPLAIREVPETFGENERVITLIESPEFGLLAYVEVGAICVGKIVQSQEWKPGTSVLKGQEKGYFLFGASTVMLYGEAGKWKVSSDIETYTQQETEVFVRLGDTVTRARDFDSN